MVFRYLIPSFLLLLVSLILAFVFCLLSLSFSSALFACRYFTLALHSLILSWSGPYTRTFSFLRLLALLPFWLLYHLFIRLLPLPFPYAILDSFTFQISYSLYHTLRPPPIALLLLFFFIIFVLILSHVCFPVLFFFFSIFFYTQAIPGTSFRALFFPPFCQSLGRVTSFLP